MQTLKIKIVITVSKNTYMKTDLYLVYSIIDE